MWLALHEHAAAGALRRGACAAGPGQLNCGQGQGSGMSCTLAARLGAVHLESVQVGDEQVLRVVCATGGPGTAAGADLMTQFKALRRQVRALLLAARCRCCADVGSGGSKAASAGNKTSPPSMRRHISCCSSVIWALKAAASSAKLLLALFSSGSILPRERTAISMPASRSGSRPCIAAAPARRVPPRSVLRVPARVRARQACCCGSMQPELLFVTLNCVRSCTLPAYAYLCLTAGGSLQLPQCCPLSLQAENGGPGAGGVRGLGTYATIILVKFLAPSHGAHVAGHQPLHVTRQCDGTAVA